MLLQKTGMRYREWWQKGHNSLIRDAVSDANLKSKYTDKKIAVLKAVSLAVDTCSGTSGGTKLTLAKDVPNLHAHGYTNYITTVYYLYKIAYLQKKNPSKSITKIMNSDSAKGAVIDLANLSYINKAINIICTKAVRLITSQMPIPGPMRLPITEHCGCLEWHCM